MTALRPTDLPPLSRSAPRRLRRLDGLRRLTRETRLHADQLVAPLFVRPGTRVRAAIPAMPGQFQLSVDQAVGECRQLQDLGVGAVLLFGTGMKKDERASGAWAQGGVVQQAVAAIKRELPSVMVITDVCLCAYTTHGHCGLLPAATGRTPADRAPKTAKRSASRDARLKAGSVAKAGTRLAGEARRDAAQSAAEAAPRVEIDDEATLQALSRVAVSHAAAGADVVAPSDMMDGRVGAIRRALDAAAFGRIPIMAYSVKYASAFYDPFRDAVDSAPAFGDRRAYQMDPANAEEAVREAALDVQEGADILMVKPALAYLDVVARLKQAFPLPIAAFNVSGEYAMVKAAAARGWLVERAAWMEQLLAMRRAGADILITYWAKDAAKALRQG